MPWIQMGALINNKGINNPDALIILGASIVGLIVTIASKNKWKILNLLVGVVCGFVAVVDLQEVLERVESVRSEDNLFSISVSVGSGLYFILIGSGLLIITSILDAVFGNKKQQSQIAPISLPDDNEKDFINPDQPQLSVADELKKYKELLDSGAITEAEYNSVKMKLLG